ncbi:MAG: SRPBCC family protein [Ideonella sp. WA131b]|jgi:uncharacterized protein YndB with AHSA1/START domain|nr:SRPBCC family protein [Ideonella sp. WA131b]
MVKTLLKALFTLVAIAGLVLTAGSLLLSREFVVERRLVMAAPAERVFEEVADPRRWAAWSAWNRRDPAMQITYEGPSSGTGAAWAWRSATEGDGRMSFTAAEPGRRLAYDLAFAEFGTTSKGEIRLMPTAAGTEVIWVMQGDMGSNPMYGWFALFADRMVGPDFETGLANLKVLVEGR